MDYQEFLQNKIISDSPSGFDIDDSALNPMLFDFQKAIVKWALRQGRAAIFADCGLGKTPMQLEWARHVCNHIGGRVLIVAPLAVSLQTKHEGVKFGIHVNVCRSQADTINGINITNYEMIHKFEPGAFSGIVLDESSILKGFTGKFRKTITEFASNIPFRLACTATPAPNDLIEIINHAEFLSIMTGKEMIALFFVQDGNTTNKWRLKGHAIHEFYKWVAGWAVAFNIPSDIGYENHNFILPPLNIIHEKVDVNRVTEGYLFPLEAVTMPERLQARRETVDERAAYCAGLVNDSDVPWIVWCNLNAESSALKKLIRGAVEVRGSDSSEHKEKSMLGFSSGDIRVLITKPSICGFGMNWQHCHKQAFVGLTDSYEQLYQAVRRCWRFGQNKPVDVHIVAAETEGRVKSNIMRKEQQSKEMMQRIIEHMPVVAKDFSRRQTMEYKEGTYKAESGNFTMMLGDAIMRVDEIESESIGHIIFSPPFPGMYTYSNSPRDVGNSTEIDEMINHFRYLVSKEKLMRVLYPGRLCAIHLMQLTAMLSRDGYIGIKDYRGRVIQMMIDEGWVFHGEVTIDKNPQIQATRNNERGLLFQSLAKDSSVMRMALADYILYFMKPGDNPYKIRAGISERYDNMNGWITENEWIEWAAPVWYRQTKDYPGGIRETDVLNVRAARSEKDERHLCPLQLGVIERCVKLWSAPGETVFSPFAGIGSEGYQSILLNRKFIGIELKESYYEQAIRNLKSAEIMKSRELGELEFEAAAVSE